MSQFVYYSTVDEWWPMFDRILAEHALRFAVDRPYRTQSCEYYGSTDEYLRTATPPISRVYLVGDAFSDAPLYLRRQESGQMVGKYFIDISRGGPALDLTIPVDHGPSDVLRLGPRWLSFQRFYWDDALTLARPAPKGLKDAFGAVKRSLQENLRRKRLEDTCWISPGAWDAFESGKAAILDSGRWFRYEDGKLKVWPSAPRGAKSKGSETD